MDRRALFFLAAAVASTLLIPVTEEAQRWVPIVVAIVYLLLAIASWADRRGRASPRRSLGAVSGSGSDRATNG